MVLTTSKDLSISLGKIHFKLKYLMQYMISSTQQEQIQMRD